MAGRPIGSVTKDKPFRDALRMQLAAAKNELLIDHIIEIVAENF